MAKRGFFAELQHQNRLAAQRQAQQQRLHAREYAAAVRNAEQARRASERAATQMARASAAERKAAEQEAKRLHQASQLAVVESLNAALAEANDEFDSVLAATLDVDDYVDLKRLRTTVAYPAFSRPDLEVATPTPPAGHMPPEPVYGEPQAPTGLNGVLGGKKKHDLAVAQARSWHAQATESWQAECRRLAEESRAQIEFHAKAEARRRSDLVNARNRYEKDCRQLEKEVFVANRRLDHLIERIRIAEPTAIQEYVGIVLGNSAYPARLEVEHEFEFDAELRELTLTVMVAPPSSVPAIKAHRYVKASDEIAAADASKKALKDRYSGMVFQVALRTLHEIFEADRAGRIETIALVVASEGSDPATGRHGRVDLVGVGADRETFLRLDLSNVVPSATLQHLGAAVSKNPYELVAIDAAPGVRGR